MLLPLLLLQRQEFVVPQNDIDDWRTLKINNNINLMGKNNFFIDGFCKVECCNIVSHDLRKNKFYNLLHVYTKKM